MGAGGDDSSFLCCVGEVGCLVSPVPRKSFVFRSTEKRKGEILILFFSYGGGHVAPCLAWCMQKETKRHHSCCSQ